ncbi:MAG: nucleotidyl transferase AbiEii/AbiGii toxin family protein [Gemmatimonadaceae bacterium]|nr:nucleotidyl transferase AbiEii/AbiGii toxin family protein [Gemmatimonadaceae bacterium]
MISRQEILSRAREWGLRPDVVEKDYVLGWMLAAVGADPEASESWILKGGTCVKKCFIETYRFSEDLDFSLRPEASYDLDAITTILTRLADRVGKMSGIVMPRDQVVVRPRTDKFGRATFEGRVGYRGPMQAPSWPRILFDITQHEPVLEAPALRAVIHPYTDALLERALVRTYDFEELLAEKTRALYERTRPRDLYDVVYIVSNVDGINVAKLRLLFRSKCTVKQIEAPSKRQLIELIGKSAELRAEWESMLAHQLQELPPIDGVLQRIEKALSWMEERTTRVFEARPSALARMDGVPFTAFNTVASGGVMERLRFAGANRLLVEFMYHGRARRVEPYSLRVAGTGNLLLYAHEMASGIVKSFKVAEIVKLRVTQSMFVPRYAIELGFAPIAGDALPAIRSPRTGVTYRPPARSRAGPVYTFECPICGKRFRRKKHDGRLRAHLYPDGYVQCAGRSGVFVGVTSPTPPRNT